MKEGNLVQSLVRGLRILQRVGQSGDGLRLKDIATELGVKTPTAHSLLKTLVHEGFLERNGGQRYHLGRALQQLVQQGQDQGFQAELEQAVQSLGARLDCTTITYAVFTGAELQVRLRVSPDRPGELQRPGHQTFSAYGSASCLAFLAFAGEEERLQFMEVHPFYEKGVTLWQSLDALERYLAGVRDQGVAVLPFQEPHRRAAAPVFSGAGELCGTLGVCVRGAGGAERCKQNDAVAAVRATAQALSTASNPVQDDRRGQ